MNLSVCRSYTPSENEQSMAWTNPYMYAKMFFIVRRCVAYNTWVHSLKAKVTLRRQLKIPSVEDLCYIDKPLCM